MGGDRMALTNVAMWTTKGWKSVTIDEATNKFPYGKVSANSRIFMCRLCKKYVTLTAPGKYSRCFKHSRGDIDKECDDRVLSSTIEQFEIHEFIPPIRIEIYNDQLFSLEMGFILPPDLKDYSGIIKIKSDNLTNSVFQYDISRLSHDCLTYLKIGNNPSERYFIDVDNSSFLLPHIVDGIKYTGVLFDYSTWKKLPDDADVIVNHEYILITTKNVWPTSDIVATLLCSMKSWYAYKVKAKTFSKSATDFFLNYGYLLTEKQAYLTFLWPEYIVSPYVIKHKTENLHLYIQGESITPKIFPDGNILCCKYCDNDNGVAVTVECNERQQLLSAVRTNVLRYTYLWKDKLDTTANAAIVRITDIKGIDAIDGINNKLPEKKILQITLQFDGYVEIIRDGWIVEKRKLNANIITEINQLQYGMSINVFQGLECVWSAIYVRTKNSGSNSESELLHTLQNARGKKIPISHMFGAVANKFEGYPQIQRWIYSQIRNGFISEKAYKIIRGK